MYPPGFKEREAQREGLLTKLSSQQKAYQSIAVDVLKSEWDLDLATVDLEGFQNKRLMAETQFERASKGLALEERVDQVQSAAGMPATTSTA